MSEPGKKFSWREKLLRSGFFVGAVLVHLIIFTLVAGWVIFRAPPPEPSVVIVPPPPSPPPSDTPRPPTTVATGGASVDVSVLGTQGNEGTPTPVPIPHKSDFDQVNGLVGPAALVPPVRGRPLHAATTIGISDERRKKILEFELKHRLARDIENKDPAGDYPVFVASYADGDWACNINLDADGNIVAGSIPNLTAKISEWTHGQVNAHVVAKPLNIGGPELLDQAPPFIFFTGHKDFVLTAQEVENLQAYVAEGGAIWGDNAEAGAGSRFDVAFRREMKRVLPNADFEPLTADAEVFKEHYQFDRLPAGMNFLAEPIEHADLDGKIAILYTPNDYSDLYTMRILPGDEQIQGTMPDLNSNSPLVTSGLFLSHRALYFRNFTLPSSLAVQRLGLNIVTYLVTRFDDDLLLPP